MPLRLLHLSDLHFGPPHLAEVARDAHRFALEWKPDLIVASGDFTQRAKAEQFQQAREWLDSLPSVPVVTTVGNHDVPLYRVVERAFRPFELYRRWIRDELDFVTLIDGMTLVSLCSAAPHRAIVNGRLSARQMEFARSAFAKARTGDLRVLVTHHHLAPAPDTIGDQAMPQLSLRINALAEMGVDIALAGHLHRGYVSSSRNAAPRPDGNEFVVVQAGTATSSRGRGSEQHRNSINTIVATADALIVTQHMHSAVEHQFRPVAEHIFPRRPRTSLSGGRAP